ncbi:M23 family metallopeptidase [Pseudooceanicola sp. MF1-13]|uniref:M23 family metallopeptidase n=1 Tax=Pseudooceanicola sp. MF1-13 TaxID=3379095 RepID=UPI003891A639
MPVDCDLGDTCYIQNYMDRDAGPGSRDFTCSGLSYDTHKGTDFALPSLAAMDRGVDVLAAAKGVVRGVRDGMIDKAYTRAEDARIDGRDCGNGLVLQHDDGWETQYCHMKQGSVRVRSGQVIEAGTVLGQIGLSGRTQFPHLHISVRHNGQPVDPFTPDARADTCRSGEARTMWIDDIAYEPGGIVSAGFADQVPSYDTIKAGTAGIDALSSDAQAIVLWGFAYGGQQADVMELEITGPQGRVFQTRQQVKKDQAQFFRAGGKRLKSPLPAGTYTGIVTLERKGRIVSQKTVEIPLR